ncbi:hypothetical protein Tco_0829757, partial [Tanacetum coccineum]
ARSGWKREKSLGYVITKEGIKADPEKVQVILRSSALGSLDKVRSLSLRLASIDRFIPKLAELMSPIRRARRSWETTEGSGWKDEAGEAFQKIKKKLSKLQALTLPKEGELLMICL